MKALLIDIATCLRIDHGIVEAAVQLFLFANNMWDPTSITFSKVHSEESHWLFCSFFLIVKAVYEDDALLINCLTHLRQRYLKVQRRRWAEMELHYLKTVNFALVYFVQRARHLFT